MSEARLYGSDISLLSPTAAALAKKDRLKWAIALTVALGAMLEVIDTSIVNVALPDIRGNLGATLSEAGWVSTGYACANVIIIPLSAWLGGRFGRKRYFLFSLIGFTLASVLCGFATNLATLVIARVLQDWRAAGCWPRRNRCCLRPFRAANRAQRRACSASASLPGRRLVRCWAGT